MNIKDIRKPKKRVEIPNIQQLDIIGYGDDNLYPQNMAMLIANSETGTTCLRRYIDFLQGDGFADEQLAQLVINSSGDTMDDLLQKVTADLGCFNGFALHVNYNMLAQITEINHVPFEFCRLTQEQASGEIEKIAIHPDWTGRKKRANKTLTPTRQTIDYIHRYNGDKDIVLEQIEEAGGIANYKGQVFWISGVGKLEYPHTIFDSAVTHLSIEEGVGNIAYKNARNGFNIGGMLVYKRGMNPDNNYSYLHEETIEDKANYHAQGEARSIEQIIADASTDLATSNIIVCEVEADEDIPQFTPFRSVNYDKEYSLTTSTACEKIYATFAQEAFYRMRTGSVGFNSDLIVDAFRLYNATTQRQRRMIQRAFARLFHHNALDCSTSNFAITPLQYKQDE